MRLSLTLISSVDFALVIPYEPYWSRTFITSTQRNLCESKDDYVKVKANKWK